jgi:hypothetical protein
MTVLPVDTVLRRGREEGGRENYGGVNLIRIYYKHICKYHNVSPYTNITCY